MNVLFETETDASMTQFPAPYQTSHMTTQGMGMQQHSYPSHSKHLVLPGALPWPVASAGLIRLSMVETAALPGPLGILTDLLIACREIALKLLASESSVGDGVVVLQGTNCIGR